MATSTTNSEPDKHRLLQQLIDLHPDGMLIVNAKGIIELSNPAVANILGYSADALLGMQIDTLVPTRHRKLHASHRLEFQHQPETRAMGSRWPLSVMHANGTELDCEILLSPMNANDGPRVAVVLRAVDHNPLMKRLVKLVRYNEQLAFLGQLALDATDATELLQQTPKVLAQAIHAEGSLVYQVRPGDPRFRVEGVYGKSLGRKVGSVVGNRVGSFLTSVLQHGVLVVDDVLTEQRFMPRAQVLSAGVRSAVGVALVNQGKAMGLVSVVADRPHAFGRDELMFVQSAATILVASFQRSFVEAQLRQAHKMEGVGQLTGGIAHDFNNLLTVIQGNLQLALERQQEAPDPASFELLSAADEATRRAADLTGKLLAFSRQQRLAPSAIDLPTFIPSLLSMLTRALGPHIRIVSHIDPNCPSCLADKLQLESSLLNIAINARDAMPKGGTLTFECSGFHGRVPVLPNASTATPLTTPQQWVRIGVTDTGKGMEPAVLERAFEPFFTTKADGHGTGFGLSSVYGYAQQSKGSVRLDSTPGKGTTVTLYLPTCAASQATTTAHKSQDPPAPADALPPGLRVLVVEDDAPVRSVTLRLLKSLRCVVQVCDSAEGALLCLRSRRRWDLLFSDIELGQGLPGTELAQLASALRPKMAVLLNSGDSNHLHLDAQANSLHWPVLRKPFNKQQLAAAIRQVLSQRGVARKTTR